MKTYTLSSSFIVKSILPFDQITPILRPFFSLKEHFYDQKRYLPKSIIHWFLKMIECQKAERSHKQNQECFEDLQRQFLTSIC